METWPAGSTKPREGSVRHGAGTVPPCSSQPLSLPQLCLPSFLQQKMVGQEFLSLGFRLQFSFLKLLLGKDVFLLRAVLPDKFLLEVHLVKMIKMVKV